MRSRMVTFAGAELFAARTRRDFRLRAMRFGGQGVARLKRAMTNF
jgi:hypothetical protein